MPVQQIAPFPSPWLNRLLAEAFRRPTLDAAEDALALARLFRNGHPLAGSGAVVIGQGASPWLRQAVTLAMKQPGHRVAREARSLARYILEAVRLLDRHGHFDTAEARERAGDLLAQAVWAEDLPPDAVAAKRLLAAAESPDAGRSQMIAEALQPAPESDAAVPALLGLAALPAAQRRARLHDMSTALLGTTARGPFND